MSLLRGEKIAEGRAMKILITMKRREAHRWAW
jgi:hypothetical protein